MRWRRARERCDVTVTSSVNNMTTSSSASSLKDRCAVVYRLCVRRRLLYHGVVLLFSGQWVALVPSSPLPSSRKKLDPSRGRCGPPSNTWFLGTTRVHAPSGSRSVHPLWQSSSIYHGVVLLISGQRVNMQWVGHVPAPKNGLFRGDVNSSPV